MPRKHRILSPFTVLMAAVCLSLIGVALFPTLPLKLSPSRNMPALYVSYSLNGATSKVVETEVTSRLEAMLARMTGITAINSSSGDGWGNISISFDKHVDMAAARFEASTIVRQVYPDLPQGTSYPYISVQSSNDNEDEERQFLVYTVNAMGNSADIDAKVHQVFKAAFTDISSIKAVDIYGSEPMEWCITYDADMLSRLGVSERDVQTAFSKYKFSRTFGKFILQTDNAADTAISLSDIRIPLPDGQYISLGSVARLEYREAEPTSYYRINGLNSIYLAFTATADANQVKLQQQIVRRIGELRQQLPAGYELHKSYDASEYINTEISKITFRTCLTVAILLLFVFLTTLSWRYVVVVTISLTCNLAIAFIAYYLLGVELHLYSLAGITISLNLMIDNTIVMVDHWRRKHNLSAILPILAATLTTIAALSIVFFLDDRLKLNLVDFSTVMIVNLALSVCTALWLVPALLNLQIDSGGEKRQRFRLRLAARFNILYIKYIRFSVRRRRWIIAVLILSFGLPLYMMPKTIDSESVGAKLYNKTFGTEIYQEKIRPITDVVFGGTLRLFSEKVYQGSYWSQSEETVLQVAASLPYGSTLAQMNEIVQRMESYISTFPEVRQFQTSIYNSQQAHISIYFTPEARSSAFPYMLKSSLITKALQLGGGSWSVYGLPDNGFSNSVYESAGSYHIKLLGYNYEKLRECADSIKAHLLTYKRIKEVEINSQFAYQKTDYTEFQLEPNKELMAQQGISVEQFFYALNVSARGSNNVGMVWNGDKQESIILTSDQYNQYVVWDMLNKPFECNGRKYKIGELCTLTKTQAPQRIDKENQQYRLCVQYEYIGSGKMGKKVMEQVVDTYKSRLPLGYSIVADQNGFYWGSGGNSQYWLLALVVLIIVFITSILFNSLRQSAVIIATIPISYIGLFLSFYLFNINFDQGGFAALILLCGITVNASIYVVNEYRKIKRNNVLQTYLKAYSTKIIPIMLTVLSTALGFIPFMCGDKEGFWFPLAVGTIGGLVFSLIGIVLFLPAFCLKKKDYRMIQ